MLFFKIRAIPLPSITLIDPFASKDKLTLARVTIFLQELNISPLISKLDMGKLGGACSQFSAAPLRP
jgi:hypothetical protein